GPAGGVPARRIAAESPQPGRFAEVRGNGREDLPVDSAGRQGGNGGADAPRSRSESRVADRRLAEREQAVQPENFAGTYAADHQSRRCRTPSRGLSCAFRAVPPFSAIASIRHAFHEDVRVSSLAEPGPKARGAETTVDRRS